MKKTILKGLGALFLAAALLLTQIPPSGLNASSSSVNNGFEMNGDTLVKYTGTATSVSVPNGVKVIGAEAFADCTGLSYVTFPSSLERIESGAFSGCTNLERIIIPEGVRSLGNGVFAGCKKLSSVSIPVSLTQIGTSAFAGCNSLKSITIASDNPNFVCQDGVLYNDDRTVIYQVLAGRESYRYMMPNTVEEIKKYAFWGCSNLQEVGLSGHLTRIDDYAFSNASGLEEISLSYSIRSIGTKAFEDCRNLVDVHIPISVTDIDPTAFDGCYKLNIKAEEGSVASDFYQEFEINHAAQLEYEDSISSNTNPHWVEDVEKVEKPETKVNISDVDNYIEWDVDSPGVLGRSKVVSRQAVIFMDSAGGTVYGGDASLSDNEAGREQESAGAAEAAAKAESAVIGGNTIANKAFYQDASLLSFQFPAGISTIGDFAFARSGLTSIRIPNGVETIKNGAFYHCDDLSSVSIPSTVTEIEPDAFTNTKWLQNWFHGGDVNEFLVVGDGILLAYKGSNSTVRLPSNVKRIAPGVFADHDEIFQVVLPESVRVVGEGAFAGCTNLTNISEGGGLVEIRDRAFYGCPIETVRIPAKVESVGLLAFGGTQATDSVVFLGNTIPVLSYEESATRLSNVDYRGTAFDNIEVAVVNAGTDAGDLKNTVLDPNGAGFSGTVFVLGTNSSAQASVVASTMPEEEAEIPDAIRVYGKRYTVTTSDSVLYAKETTTVSDNSLQGLLVVDHDKIRRDDVEVALNGSTINTDGYHFYISNPGLGERELKEQIEEYYGPVNADNCFTMDLSMYDPTDTIPIKKLGNNAITVTMPVPVALMDDEICVISLDENGKPEVTFCTYVQRDGKSYISFDIQHFSPYALYGAQGQLKDQITEKRSRSSSSSLLDDTPDTGDTLDIRVILAVGLAALGGSLMLAGFKKPVRRRIKKA
ncbi:MAG: leucine-rich repeat domain-containing protein [Lachnospiraceae bacterium]|nr:leucine-rich repeat domain-containing protein [Lachnospiraceae bacterium]